MSAIYIVAAKRSAIGTFGGSLSSLSPVELGTAVVKALLAGVGIESAAIDSIVVGNVLGSGHGMNLARQIGIGAGLTDSSTAYMVNMVCGSGLQSVRLAAQAIQSGDARLVLAGGVESMSQAGYISLATRFGARMGNSSFNDLMITDGLTDAFQNGHMGCTAENIARKYGISREAQDAFALLSQQKALESIAAGRFREEIVPVEYRRKKENVQFLQDEYPRADVSLDGLARLRPAFDEAGSVTAGNASGINDGAAFLLLCSEEALHEYNLSPIATIKGSAVAGVAPALMGLGPVAAAPRALKNAGVRISDLACIESNEAFAVQAIVVAKELDFNDQIVNSWGGAIALGHPIGASGARILVTLLHRLQAAGGGLGLATLCVGGGQGVALIVEQKP